MTRFAQIRVDEHGHAVIEHERDIDQAAIQACPHFILVADHYRQDGTCRCDDPDAREMADWGYEWNGKEWS